MDDDSFPVCNNPVLLSGQIKNVSMDRFARSLKEQQACLNKNREDVSKCIILPVSSPDAPDIDSGGKTPVLSKSL